MTQGGDQQDRRPVSLLYQLSFAAGFAEWFFIPGAADRLPCHVWYCSKAVMNGSDSAALVGADWESLSSVQFVPKDGTLCAPGSEFALYGLKR